MIVKVTKRKEDNKPIILVQMGEKSKRLIWLNWDEVDDFIAELQKAQEECKKMHDEWIRKGKKEEVKMEYKWVRCPICGRHHFRYLKREKASYCVYCGYKISEEDFRKALKGEE